MINDMPDVVDLLKKLPELCYTVSLMDPTKIIAIRRGVRGYYPIELDHPNQTTLEVVAGLNKGIEPAAIMAMENGSHFGWEIPAAGIDKCREDLRTHPKAAEKYAKLVS